VGDAGIILPANGRATTDGVVPVRSARVLGIPASPGTGEVASPGERVLGRARRALRARIAAALGDRAGAATLVREAVARGYACDGITHADAELGTLFP
jgi:hypothetical protein